MSDKILLFGRSYTLVGDSNSDIVLKTKGQVKIQWGGKFIDLIKDGKINVDSSFIFKSNLIRSKDGFYVLEDGSVWLKISGNAIPIVSNEVGTTYVSFLELETNSELKHLALINIGFLYPDLESINDNSLQNGIIYIETEKKLYIVSNGELSEFLVSVPNPFLQLFIIAKNDSDKGSLVIKGTGLSNSILFDLLIIYNDPNQSIIESQIPILFKVKGKEILTIDNTYVLSLVLFQSNRITSLNASDSNGFRLYMNNGKSILEVDLIIVRDDDNRETQLFPEYWFLDNNIISTIEVDINTEQNEIVPNEGVIPEVENEEETVNKLSIAFKSDASYLIGDVLGCYININNEEDDEINSPTFVELIVTNINNEEGTFEVDSSIPISTKLCPLFLGIYVFLIKSENKLPIRLKDNNIDIVEYGEKIEDIREVSIKTRIGDLSEIKDGENNLEDYGIYSDKLIIGGISEDNFPKYTETLNNILFNVDIYNSDSYNCALASVGLIKKILKMSLEAVEELKQKVKVLEDEIVIIKELLNPETTK